MKKFLRSLVPTSIQVPVKYTINRWRKQLEAEIQLLPFLVQRGEVAVDIGGNRGQYTYALWRLGSKVEVFEPNPLCSRILMAWAASKDSVTVHPVGVSDKSGYAVLRIPVDKFGNVHDASASLGEVIAVDTCDVKVSLSSIDSFEFEKVMFVKIDVEGHEYNVLQGGENLFQRQQPAILIEVEQRHNNRPMADIFDLILSWGYRGFFLKNRTLVGLENFDAKIDQKLDNFNNSQDYVNNFVFLSEVRLAKGYYEDLFAVWGAQ